MDVSEGSTEIVVDVAEDFAEGVAESVVESFVETDARRVVDIVADSVAEPDSNANCVELDGNNGESGKKMDTNGTRFEGRRMTAGVLLGICCW